MATTNAKVRVLYSTETAQATEMVHITHIINCTYTTEFKRKENRKITANIKKITGFTTRTESGDS